MRGFKTRLHLYTVPGHVYYDASRKLLLKGVDGIVFVADSRAERMDANIETLQSLYWDLKALASWRYPEGYDLMEIPYVLQLNKRDLPNIVPIEEMKKRLLIKDEPVVEAVAGTGIGVIDALQAIAKLILGDLTKSDDDDAVNELPVPSFLLRGKPPQWRIGHLARLRQVTRKALGRLRL